MRWICVSIAALAFAGVASAATPGMSLAQAQSRLELKLRLVFDDTVTQAQENLRLAKQLGGPEGIRIATDNLAAAKRGMQVDNASCAGLHRVQGGFDSFRCRLLLSDELGYHATAKGLMSRNRSSGRWQWVSQSFLRDRLGVLD